MMVFFLSLILLSGCSKENFEHNKGVLFLSFQDVDKAQASFTRALISNPDLDISRYALSYSFLPKEKLKDAMSEIDYLLSEKLNNKKRFKLLFAKAVIYSLLGETEDALKNYQECLYIQPGSIEVKTNIELLFSGGDGNGKGAGKKSKKKSKGKESQEGEEGEPKKKEDDPQSKDEIEKQKKESMKKKNLSPQDLERILKELKQQEKKIRSNSYQGEKDENRENQKATGNKPW